MANRHTTGRREAAGFIASAAIHIGLLALLVSFVASSPPQAGKRTQVPISVLDRRKGSDSSERFVGTGVADIDPGSEMKTADAERSFTGRRRFDVPGKARPESVESDDDRTTGDSPAPNSGKADEENRNAEDGTGAVARDVGSAVGGNGQEDPGSRSGGSGPGKDEPGGGASGADQGPGRGAGIGAGNNGVRPDGAEYARMVRTLLEKRGAYPRTARRLGQEGTVEMAVIIEADGSVSGRSIRKSSGFEALDRAAIDSAGLLTGLPPPPDGKPVTVVIPVRFSLRR